MADLALALVKIITKFIDDRDDAEISKIFNFFTTLMTGINLALFIFARFKFREFPDSFKQFLLVMLAIGFIYVVRDFEGFRQYILMGILGVVFVFLMYKALSQTEPQNNRIVEPQPN